MPKTKHIETTLTKKEKQAYRDFMKRHERIMKKRVKITKE